MLTKLTIRNFKQFDSVEIELGNMVVFIGPNDSGKTTALQALALWDVGLRRWNEKRAGKTVPKRRSGVTINRRDLIAIPIPDANLLWRDLHTHDSQSKGGKKQTTNVRIDITLEGVTGDRPWQCGLEFDYANEEALYCRPLRQSDTGTPERMPVPGEAASVQIAFLPPMSGLAANETRLDSGAINVRLGEGRTAEVLRNLCYRVAETDDVAWVGIVDEIKGLFGATLDPPVYVAERGEITMTYRTKSDVRLDISASGRGLQQTLLLLAHMAMNPKSVLLLDEPDAHLEILRQRQVYEVLTRNAQERDCQVVAASHSEIVLNEAAGRDVVIAFLGRPHRIDDRGSQVVKSLREIGFEQYYQAEQTGWVLYLEGSTDLAILRAFAEATGHPAKNALERPFVQYVGNLPRKAEGHFHGLKEAKRDLVGFLLCDRIGDPLKPTEALGEYMWQRREIENYLCQPATLLAYAEGYAREAVGPLFEPSEHTAAERRKQAMQESIQDHVAPAVLKNRDDPWWSNVKASDDFLDRVFEAYLRRLDLPRGLISKSDYHVLARFVPREAIADEVVSVLDQIHRVSQLAMPRQD
ncbi:MAG: AAA family ATPase [Planctomycetia bacterium]|nr:AAA family ATPase [Planctomycetia bacterium]